MMQKNSSFFTSSESSFLTDEKVVKILNKITDTRLSTEIKERVRIYKNLLNNNLQGAQKNPISTQLDQFLDKVVQIIDHCHLPVEKKLAIDNYFKTNLYIVGENSIKKPLYKEIAAYATFSMGAIAFIGSLFIISNLMIAIPLLFIGLTMALIGGNMVFNNEDGISEAHSKERSIFESITPNVISSQENFLCLGS